MARSERIVREALSLSFVQVEQTKQKSFGLEGEILTVFVDVPNFTSTVTATCTISDVDGYKLFEQTGLAKNLVSKFTSGFPLSGMNTLTITLSAALQSGDGGMVKVTIYARRVG
ncbi:MAG: hypothetical protein GX443_06900 [Deltaproteobacteria bacterium]|nr:hypothetical protein [Deltaproteobacteria bacterium]